MSADAKATLQKLHAELEGRVADAALRTNVPGVAVGIVFEGEEDYVCHGVTSVKNPLPVTEGTLFQIGSTTKTYTGTAIMALVERGLIDLAAPVRDYIPELRLQDEETAAGVTVLNLLNHTAGWAGDYFADTGYGDDALAQYIGRLADAPQENPLGERVSYNNAAVNVAGRVIEKVTGKTYEESIKELVLDPLGLKEHFFFPWEIMTHRFAAGHAKQDDGLRITAWYEARNSHPAGGGFSASVREQLRYARFHMGDGDGVLRRETLDRMKTLTTPPDPSGRVDGYGVSWHLRDIDGVRIVSHGGSTLGHQSSFEMVPSRDFAFAILTNARHGGELLESLAEWIFSAYVGLVDRLPKTLPLTSEQLAEYAGVYEGHMGAFNVVVEGDRLVGTVTFNPEALAELLPPGESLEAPAPMPFKILPNDRFLVPEGEAKGMQGALLRDADGNIAGIDLGGRVMTRRR